eukprot:gene50142-61359_t
MTSRKTSPIPDELAQTLFQPFKRMNKTSPTNRNGLGLGLYIANQVITGHGGTLDYSYSGTHVVFTARDSGAFQLLETRVFAHGVSGSPALQGGGALGQLIEAFDWSATPLGPIDSWSPTLKATTSLILQSAVPIVTLWGESGVMIYNDGYAEFAAARHPMTLGSNVRESWPEVADFNDNVIKIGLA